MTNKDLECAARAYGMDMRTLRRRVRDEGMSIDDAILLGPVQRERMHNVALRFGIHPNRLRRRVELWGMSLKEAVDKGPGEMHGKSGTAEYKTWAARITRCTNPKYHRYPDYGGRGITVCERWSDSFLSFLEDMGKRPGPEYSIDRINNDGNYEPENCRWATRKQQANNRRPRSRWTKRMGSPQNPRTFQLNDPQAA